jgi:hypothetical protein
MTDLSKSLNQEEEDFRQKVVSALAEMGIDVGECRSCGEPIIFLKTTAGKWMPVNMALQSHFSDCPAADRFRKRGQ